MNANLDAPGLKRRPRKNGDAWYWYASAVSRGAEDYPTKTARLHGVTDEERAHRCRQLTAELREWLSGKPRPVAFNGTLGSLIDLYRSTDGSPYRGVQQNTRRDYDQRLAELRRTVGAVDVRTLNAVDFTRWHTNFKNGDHVRKAHGLMTMVRMLIGWGVAMRYPGCSGTLEVLHQMTFESPRPRKAALTFDQAAKIVDLALTSGRRSLALGQALQFELAIRQVDVIGKWTIAPMTTGGITAHGKRWGDGLLWSHVTADLTVSKETTKTRANGEWDLRRCPLVMTALAAYPPEDRVGPMIVSEMTGMPYEGETYSRAWRALATEAGVPSTVWNRDSRAGGITEGFDAGASSDDMRRLATHADAVMTHRYDRGALASSARVADLRVARRVKDGQA